MSTTGALTTKDVLVRVKEILHVGGWCQEDYRTKDGQHCLMGAVHEASPSVVMVGAVNTLLQEALRETLDYPCPPSITQWNDSLLTEYEDVVDLVDRAIKKAEPLDGEINGL